VSPLEAKLRRIIEDEGPIPFSRFMSIALYEEGQGYYVKPRSPFGRQGDFFTASQLQPVFGRYVQAQMERFAAAQDHFVELGPGREDLRDAFPQSTYSPVHPGQTIPKTKRAFLFANEFFDALPVELYQEGQMLRVGTDANRFIWHPEPPKTGVSEKRPLARHWLAQAWESTDSGYFLILDYGYRERERERFAQGSLLGYRQHRALTDVLSHPGEQDISAHVNWDDLIEDAVAVGWQVLGLESLRRSMLSLGEEWFQEAAALDSQQLKTLLLSFGESFDVLILHKPAPGTSEDSKPARAQE
jgi:SAM-dependent MidA family methyltransferase